MQRLLLCLTLLFVLSLSAPTSHSVDGQSISSSLSNLTGLDHALERPITKRDDSLYDLWSSTPNSQKATGNSAQYHKWDRSEEKAYGITYLYGCLGIIISDPDFCIVGKCIMNKLFETRNQETPDLTHSFSSLVRII